MSLDVQLGSQDVMTIQTSRGRKRDYVAPILLKHATLKDITLLTGSGFSHNQVDK